MKLSKIYFLSALFILLLTSCAIKNGAIIAGDGWYSDALETSTRNGKAYEEFETKLIAHVTYKDLDFIKAQINYKGAELMYDRYKVSRLISAALSFCALAT